jgi:hypothetical protein
VRRFGIHAQPTTLVLTFDKPLEPTLAQDSANYRIVELGGSGRPIGIKAAVYDSATQTVTLSPVHHLNLHDRFRLTVVGTGANGLTDTSGDLLDGRGDGDRGSDFITIVTAKNLVLTTTDPAIVRAYEKIIAKLDARLGAAVAVRHHGLRDGPPHTTRQWVRH